MNRAALLVPPTLLAAAVFVAACSEGVVDPPPIGGEGVVAGLVYLDIDGNEELSAADEPVEGATVLLTVPGSGAEVARDTTDASGEYLMEAVPVGTLEIGIDATFLGDTLLTVPMDSTRFTLQADGALVVGLGVTYPQLSLSEARAAVAGIPIFTQGVALNQRGQAPGGAIHIEADGVAMRVLVPPSQQALVGDSVRVLGRVGRDLGQPVLVEAEVYRVVPLARDVDPSPVSMGDAATAAGGLDARLVEFTSGSVVSSTTVPEGYLVEVTDGSDTLSVRLLTAQGFGFVTIPDGSEIIRLVGLLVPDDGTSTWSLVPRFPADVRLGPPPA